MKSRKRTRTRPAGALSLLAALSSCAWAEIDALLPASGDATAGPPTVVGDAGGDAQSSADVTGSEPSSLDAPDSFAFDGGDAAPEASVNDLPCSGSPPIVRQWNFDSTAEGWAIAKDKNIQATVTWTGAIGDPSPGALAVEARAPTSADGGAGSAGVWLEYATPLGNLSGRTVSAWAWLDSGSSPQVKMFVQTGSTYAWGDDGTTILAPRTWTCLAFPVSTPSYNNAMYDPANVIEVGIEMRAQGPFRIYVDTVRYY